jgi:hypothetical protein
VNFHFSLGKPAAAPRKRLDINLPGAQEVEEIDPLIFACLRDSQKCQILVNAFPGRRPGDHVPKPRKCLDGMFGIIVVPWHIIVTQERKQFVAIFLEALLTLYG